MTLTHQRRLLKKITKKNKININATVRIYKADMQNK